MSKRLVIGIDTGGTFTDCVYRTGGQVEVFKIRSTPDDPSRAILQAIAKIAQQTGAEELEIRHGTTVATNALLERKGAQVAFVTTAGFEDTLAIGRQARPSLYDWNVPSPSPARRTGLVFRCGGADRPRRVDTARAQSNCAQRTATTDRCDQEPSRLPFLCCSPLPIRNTSVPSRPH